MVPWACEICRLEKPRIIPLWFRDRLVAMLRAAIRESQGETAGIGPPAIRRAGLLAKVQFSNKL
jgi:hypothetical protein